MASAASIKIGNVKIKDMKLIKISVKRLTKLPCLPII
jgi:hypothetical protein